LVALDLGTENVRVVVAEAAGERLDIIGVGRSKCSGLKRGVVVNMESTVEAIRKAIEEAELMAGRDVVEAGCNITGSHIRSFNKNGVVSVNKREVRPDDVTRVLKAARTLDVTPARDYVHVLPIDFTVDDNYGLQSPVGIAGVRLETNVHIITAARSARDNIITCCNREAIRVNNLMFSLVASSGVLLREEEREVGVLLMDIGAGTCEFGVWFNGSLIQSGVLPTGGSDLTRELAVNLGTTRADAERVKVDSGCAMASKVDESEHIEVPAVAGGRGPQTRQRRALACTVEPILEDIFATVADQIQQAGNERKVAAGVVLTGGVSRMPFICDLAHTVLGIPARLGEVSNVAGEDREDLFGGVTTVVSDPAFATCLGMLLNMHKEGMQPLFETQSDKPRIWRRVKDWLKESFA
jgi:cell division protein FtsA